MRTESVVLVCALMFLPGCGDYSNTSIENDLLFLYAVPSASNLKIRIAENQDRAAEEIDLELSQSAKISETFWEEENLAAWYVFTLVMSRSVNFHVFGFVDLFNLISSYPPTARMTDKRYWGPWPSSQTPSTDWRFIMERDRFNDLFGFSLQSNSTANRHTDNYPSSWVDCVSGRIRASEQGSRRGVGSFVLDLEACSRAEKTGEKGIANIGFDCLPDAENPMGKTFLTIRFIDFVSRDMLQERPNPKPLNALYVYEERSDFSGMFKFDVWTDLHADENPNLDAEEHVELFTQWSSTKAGRADIRISGGDLGSAVILVAECFDGLKRRVYYKDSAGLIPEEGDVENCELDPYVFVDDFRVDEFR